MPAQYLAMKRKFLLEGLGEDAAQGKAARIYNAKHPGNPVGPGYHARKDTGSHKGDRYTSGKQDE